MLPSDAKERKEIPIFTGFLKYFPLAVAACAKLSVIGNEQHNPGEPLHWSRGKSTDHFDTMLRHAMEAEGIDSDLVPHVVKTFWRAGAACQTYLEENPWDTTVAKVLEHIAIQKRIAENVATAEVQWLPPMDECKDAQAVDGKFDHCPDSTTFDEFLAAHAQDIQRDMEFNAVVFGGEPGAKISGVFLEPIEANAQYCVCFREEHPEGLDIYVTYKGPFPDMFAAEEYAQLNPHNIAGLRTIHALNRP